MGTTMRNTYNGTGAHIGQEAMGKGLPPHNERTLRMRSLGGDSEVVAGFWPTSQGEGTNPNTKLF